MIDSIFTIIICSQSNLETLAIMIDPMCILVIDSIMMIDTLYHESKNWIDHDGEV